MSHPIAVSSSAARLMPALSILSALATFAALQIVACWLTGGFDYPLDDPYIHLAIAEQIAAGGYGVNAGEYASPGSSALYPLLLVPFHGTDLHRFMPLVWNVVGLAASSYLWGRLLAEAGWGRAPWRVAGIAAAVLGPIAFMTPVVAALGMEHALHVACALAVVLGLHRHFATGQGAALILLGAFFGTALRIEGAALAILAAAALMLTGRRSTGLATLVAGLAPIAIFATFLVSLGLDPLPSSVKAKLAIIEGAQSAWQDRLAVFGVNVTEPAGLLIAGLALATLALSRLCPRIKDSHWSIFAGVIVLAAFAHLLFGQIGWLDRYENYILMVSAAGFLVLLPKAYDAAPDVRAFGAVAAMLIAGFVAYKMPFSAERMVEGARAIHLQQGQMATFAKDYLKTLVAVNDLGRVAFQNPDYVLDLWGLASQEARAFRLNNPAPGWTGGMTDARNIPVAMIYDHWFDAGQEGDQTGETWVRLGMLNLTVEGGFLGAYQVASYATSPDAAPMLETAISAWEPTLLPGSQFVWDESYDREGRE